MQRCTIRYLYDLLIDIVFSLDSVMTAVGMVDHIIVAMAAVVVAMIAMALKIPKRRFDPSLLKE